MHNFVFTEPKKNMYIVLQENKGKGWKDLWENPCSKSCPQEQGILESYVNSIFSYLQ